MPARYYLLVFECNSLPCVSAVPHYIMRMEANPVSGPGLAGGLTGLSKVQCDEIEKPHKRHEDDDKERKKARTLTPRSQLALEESFPPRPPCREALRLLARIMFRESHSSEVLTRLTCSSWRPNMTPTRPGKHTAC